MASEAALGFWKVFVDAEPNPVQDHSCEKLPYCDTSVVAASELTIFLVESDYVSILEVLRDSFLLPVGSEKGTELCKNQLTTSFKDQALGPCLWIVASGPCLWIVSSRPWQALMELDYPVEP